ncbi:glycosyltransferase [Bosea sp. 117]|uniref:glycosyltransferase family 32 protein n=1 Tax=Bosea sp. 117 TaxID=1125973 RepID=UPI000689BE65|nr:glycosyltransferase [Bosea sp. 117]
MRAIPKIIFQTWKTRTGIPESYLQWRHSIIRHNPSYRHALWGDRENRSFIKKLYPWFLPIFDGYEHNIMRADVIRYFFLYHFGGIYIDLDTECLRPLDSYLERGNVVLGRMGVDPEFSQSIPNAVMMSAPRQEFWLFVFHLLVERAKRDIRPEYKTGPDILKSSIEIYNDSSAYKSTRESIHRLLADNGIDMRANRTAKIHVAPARDFYPIDWSDPIHQYFIRRKVVRDGVLFSDDEKRELFPHSALVSYWTHGWEPERWPE